MTAPQRPKLCECAEGPRRSIGDDGTPYCDRCGHEIRRGLPAGVSALADAIADRMLDRLADELRPRPPEFADATAIAAETGFHVDTIGRWAREGRIRSHQHSGGRARRYVSDEVIADLYGKGDANG